MVCCLRATQHRLKVIFVRRDLKLNYGLMSIHGYGTDFSHEKVFVILVKNLEYFKVMQRIIDREEAQLSSSIKR